MTTFADLLADLQTQDQTQPLVFATDEGEIGAGYHVTELKHATIKSIDCGGHLRDWTETRLQLLDGQGPTRMRVGKFASIIEKGLSALPELADAPLQVEFGKNNNMLRLMSVNKSKGHGDRVVLALGDISAVCKPMQQPRRVEGTKCCA